MDSDYFRSILTLFFSHLSWKSRKTAKAFTIHTAQYSGVVNSQGWKFLPRFLSLFALLLVKVLLLECSESNGLQRIWTLLLMRHEYLCVTQCLKITEKYNQNTTLINLRLFGIIFKHCVIHAKYLISVMLSHYFQGSNRFNHYVQASITRGLRTAKF